MTAHSYPGRRAHLFLLLALAAATFSSTAVGQEATLRVEAGPFDRQQTVVRFETEGRLAQGAYRAQAEQGEALLVQVDGEGVGWFVLDGLAEGQTRLYTLRRIASAAEARHTVTALREGGRVVLAEGTSMLAQYHHEPGPLPRNDIDSLYTRAGYLHPVLTPNGTIITDDYPPNHIHHHGVWAAWTKTEFEGRQPDFWNMGAGTGTVVVDSLLDFWSGPVHAGLVAAHRYVDLSAPEPVSVLQESWTVRAFGIQRAGRAANVFDVQLEQNTASESPLLLPEYRYGGIGYRGLREWDGPEHTVFLTSEGRDRSDGHATRARWCYVGGLVDGRPAGVAVLGHPENFRAPQPMRIHPNEPFFNYAPSQAGDWAIESDRPLVLRYRFVAFDGEPDPAWIDRLWNDYAEGPRVSFE